jgi:WD40 repeat protein
MLKKFLPTAVSLLAPFLFAASGMLWGGGSAVAAVGKAPGGPVSFYQEVRPIFQANCHGCHQPSKAKGGYVMTNFEKLIAGGEKDGVAVIPGDVHKGSLIEQITPNKGEAEMPKGKPPLAEHELDLIRRWVAEGAKDDTPADAKKVYDAEHPPVYPRLPVVSSIDYSPDGQFLAVAGFHEVLLHKADGSALDSRLIGISERIQSVRFSPDGKWLAASGGDPSRLGEIQIWEVATRKLKVSAPLGWDTLYGLSWSPDSKKVAFGCADNTVRAIDVESGKQVFQMGSHNDWVLETAFSEKGDHLISVGRDMTAKLSEFAGERFVDNITSITPGALRGGMNTVDRHPASETIVVGGSDGAPQIFRIFRTTARKIGDNANLIQKYPDMTGRIFATRFSKTGDMFVAGSALDGRGEVSVFSTSADGAVPADIAAIRAKPSTRHTPAEAQKLKDFESQAGKRISQVSMDETAIYSVAFHPEGKLVSAAGSDGKVRVIEVATGKVVREFPAAPVTANAVDRSVRTSGMKKQAANEGGAKEILPEGKRVADIVVEPAQISIGRKNDYVQLLISAKYEGGDVADVTRSAKIQLSNPVADLTSRGQLHPKTDGTAKLRVEFGGKAVDIPVSIQGTQAAYSADFIQDVNPLMTKMGCNQGTCHGAKDGKGGFKLSLRGYDPDYDLRSLTDDMASRRVTIASPDDSLMLLKAVAEVPHEGGRRTRVDDKYYHVLRQWITSGAQLNKSVARVARIELSPQNPVVQSVGSRQQIRVVAHFADGVSRDVTNEAFVETGNPDVASVDASGLVTTLRRGEAPMLARYEGNYAATTVTVMGDRSGFEWKEPITWTRIDELVAAKWKRMQIEPSDLCADNEFLRRVYLDLTGLPPGADRLRAFLADPRERRVKREAVVNELIGSIDFVEHWTNKWSDLLQVNTKFLGKEGAEGFRAWIREAIDKNTPYDEFVRAILTASGSNKANPAASYWKILRQPAEAMENTTHLFLATRFNCNKCHDHPFERWTQDQYYQTAAYFAQFSLSEDPASAGKKLAGTAVEGGKPVFEIINENPRGEIKHDRTGKVTAPQVPYSAQVNVEEKAPRRTQFAAWLTSADNRYFASSYVNRIWGYLLGRGIIEPLDDIRAGNPPTNPELLEYLTQEFVKSGFNTRKVFQLVCNSRTYQLSLRTNKWNEDDTVNYSHAVARRLSAETLFDSVVKVTGATSSLPGAAAGSRAAQMVDSSSEGAGGFLATLGKPARESACECERSSDLRLGSVMALLSGPTISGFIQNPKNEISQLVQKESDDSRLATELFQRVLSREPSAKEVEATAKMMNNIEANHRQVLADWEAKEKQSAPIIAKMEQQRLEAIAKAKEAAEAFEAEIKPARDQAEARRKNREQQATEKLTQWEDQLPASAEKWISDSNPAAAQIRWTLAVPKTVSSTAGGVKLQVEKDGTVVATGNQNKTDYDVILPSPLAKVTGILIEALPDPKSPKYGPGRGPDGNFVLNEISLKAATGPKGADKAVALDKAWASFEQQKYPVADAIDGKDNAADNGWAVGGATGRRQVAAFRLKQALDGITGTQLSVRLTQKSRDGAVMSRFRIYVTTAEDPLGEGVPVDVAEAAASVPESRSEAQKQVLLAHFRSVSAEYWAKDMELQEAKKPLPPDPKLVALKETLAKVSEPIRLDPDLVQLRLDAEASKKQIESKRLTAAQDLTWALINNPAFLFNR